MFGKIFKSKNNEHNIYQNSNSSGKKKLYEEIKRTERESRNDRRQSIRKSNRPAYSVANSISTTLSTLFVDFNDKKRLSEALEEVKKSVYKTGVKSGFVGLENEITKSIGRNNSPLLTDSAMATVLAGGLIDSGVAIYSYIKGNINASQLHDMLADSSAKGVATVYFTKSIEYSLGKTNPYLPVAIYTMASYVLTNTREIIKNAELEAAEYERAKELHNQTAKMVREFRNNMNDYFADLERHQKRNMEILLDEFEYNSQMGDDYDKAILSIVNFSNQMGITLQHSNFADFRKAMLDEENFELTSKRRK